MENSLFGGCVDGESRYGVEAADGRDADNITFEAVLIRDLTAKMLDSDGASVDDCIQIYIKGLQNWL